MLTLETTVLSRYRMTQRGFALVSAQIATLNKRAKKIGVPPIEAQVVSVEDETDDDGNVISYVVVELSGIAPVISGWRFVCVIAHSEEGNILRYVPPFTSQSVSEKYRTAAPSCDHCKLTRRRNDTYVLRNELDEEIQVGRNCLRDFTGHENPFALAEYAEMIGGLGDFIDSKKDTVGGGYSSGSGKHYWNLAQVLAIAASVIRENGEYVFAKRAREAGLVSSASIVRSALTTLQNSGFVPNADDAAMVEKVLAWVGTLPREDNDWNWNVSVIANAGVCSFDEVGIAASMVGVYWLREILPGIKAARAAKKPSEFVGEVGKRQIFDVRVEKIIPIYDAYGILSSTLHIMEDSDGNSIKVFATNHLGLNEGDTATIKATVKSHDTYKGNKQTLVNRVAVLKSSGSSEAAAAS